LSAMVLQRSHSRWQHPATQVHYQMVMDLGLKSDPNMHRAQCGPFRVRIEARQRSGWCRRDFWKADREIDIYVGDRNLERKSGRKKASTYSTSGVPTIGVMQAQNACGSREVGTPPFPFPPGGKPGRAGSPHAAGTLSASKKRWHTSMPRLPPQGGFQTAALKPPLRIPRWTPFGLRPDGQPRSAG
jgi:hypothetical protein